jgi:1-acyl-sn-glycerol-3-phosphate acyltransferase
LIRSFWVGIVLLFATFYYGTTVLVASLLGVRGGLYSHCTQKWARAVMRASGVPIRLEGAGMLRPGEPRIVVSNHLSGFDIFALAAVLPTPYAFVGKKELNSIPFFGRAWVAAGHISIDRSDRQKAIATLQAAGRRIREDGSTVIIFAEGTRSTTGELLPFKKGAFALAVESGVPIIPTVIVGTDRISPKGSLRVRPHPITIHFGDQVLPDRRGPQALETTVQATRERMQEILDRNRGALPADRPA